MQFNYKPWGWRDKWFRFIFLLFHPNNIRSTSQSCQEPILHAKFSLFSCILISMVIDYSHLSSRQTNIVVKMKRKILSPFNVMSSDQNHLACFVLQLSPHSLASAIACSLSRSFSKLVSSNLERFEVDSFLFPRPSWSSC